MFSPRAWVRVSLCAPRVEAGVWFLYICGGCLGGVGRENGGYYIYPDHVINLKRGSHDMSHDTSYDTVSLCGAVRRRSGTGYV